MKLPQTWRLPKHTDMTYRSMVDLEGRTQDLQQSAKNDQLLKRMMEDQNIYISTIATGLQLYVEVLYSWVNRNLLHWGKGWDPSWIARSLCNRIVVEVQASLTTSSNT